MLTFFAVEWRILAFYPHVMGVSSCPIGSLAHLIVSLDVGKFLAPQPHLSLLLPLPMCGVISREHKGGVLCR